MTPPTGNQIPAGPLFRHVLIGCAPRPLGSYLKALGILRIVAEQVDPAARGYWEEEHFVLVSRLDEDGLRGFFLNHWRPSPFVSPWNKGSGLLGEDKKGVEPMEKSLAPRFALLREGIAQAKALTREMEQAVADEKRIKGEKTRLKDKAAKEKLDRDPDYKRRLAAAGKACKRLKDELQPECQRRWRGPALRWLRAAVVIGADGKATFPSLLGTGGNDSKLDFTNNSLQRLGELFDLGSALGAPKEGAASALGAALWGTPSASRVAGGIGQYSPAVSGGANATAGPLAESQVNPWDLPLLLEGALLFTASAGRRLGGAGSERTLAPFSSRPLAAGYGSATNDDESPRGEQWMPIWSRPWSASEVGALLLEGRCQVGRRPSEDAVDVARAIARLGLARGVDAFERYAYMPRNGQASYAVPLGRWVVRPEPRGQLLDDLMVGRWWERIRRAARDDHAPASLRALDRRLSDAVVAALAHGEPARWQQVLLQLALLEQQLVDSGNVTASKRLEPIPRLSVGWIAAADDNSAEVRLALALAGAGAPNPRGGRPLDSVRSHWLPLDERGRFAKSDRALRQDPRVVMHGKDAEGDLLRLVQRRVLEAERGAARRLPLGGVMGTEADVDAILAWVAGEVDVSRTVLLARAFAALDWRGFRLGGGLRRGRENRPMDPLWAALRLAYLPTPWPGGPAIPADPAALRLLATGETSRGLGLVFQRLRAAGVSLPLRVGLLDPARARRFVASLAFPISPDTALVLAKELATPDAARKRSLTHAH